MEMGTEPLRLQLTIEAAAGGGKQRSFCIFSRPESADEWTKHAEGILSAAPAASPMRVRRQSRFQSWPSGPLPMQRRWISPASTRTCCSAGSPTVPPSAGSLPVSQGEHTAIGRVVLPQERATADRYVIHPALPTPRFTPCFRFWGRREIGSSCPFSFSEVAIYATGSTEIFVQVRVLDALGRAPTVSLLASDFEGDPSCGWAPCSCAARGQKASPCRPEGALEHLYSVELERVNLPTAGEPGSIVLVGRGALSRELRLPCFEASRELAAADRPRRPSSSWILRMMPREISPARRPRARSQDRMSSRLSGGPVPPGPASWPSPGAQSGMAPPSPAGLAHAPSGGLVRSARRNIRSAGCACSIWTP